MIKGKSVPAISYDGQAVTSTTTWVYWLLHLSTVLTDGTDVQHIFRAVARYFATSKQRTASGDKRHLRCWTSRVRLVCKTRMCSLMLEMSSSVFKMASLSWRMKSCRSFRCSWGDVEFVLSRWSTLNWDFHDSNVVTVRMLWTVTTRNWITKMGCSESTVPFFV